MGIRNLPGSYKRSGGPKTAKGKSDVSLNALKFGTYSATQVLPSESPEDFQALANVLLKDLQPQTVMMQIMAMSIVNIVWRMKRLDYFEACYFTIEYERPMDSYEMNECIGCDYEKVVDGIVEVDNLTFEKEPEYFKELLNELLEIERLSPISWPDLAVLKKVHSELYELLKKMSDRRGSFDQIVSQPSSDPSIDKLWIQTKADTKDWLHTQIKGFELVDRFEIGSAKNKDLRMFRQLIKDSASRPRNELTKALQQAMADYYRERDRYRDEHAILINQCKLSEKVENVQTPAIEAQGVKKSNGARGSGAAKSTGVAKDSGDSEDATEILTV